MAIATNVTVNTSHAAIYWDTAFAAAGFTLINWSNTYKAIAQDIDD